MSNWHRLNAIDEHSHARNEGPGGCVPWEQHEAEVERLREIERVFNEGWLPPIPGERGTLSLRAIRELRALIPEQTARQTAHDTPEPTA